MPKENVILNLPGFTVKKVTGYDPVVLKVHYRRKAKCPYCEGSRLRKKDRFCRQIKHELIGYRRCFLEVQSYKFQCYGCHKYFNQRFPGIGRYQQATERLKEQVFQQHSQGINQKTLAKNLKLGKGTIERWYHQYYQRLNKHRQNSLCPRVLGIDEHRFSKALGFATTFCDLAKHKIMDVAQGKSLASLQPFLESLQGRERVKVVCIDLNSTYASIVKQYFPNAQIVADRFHVIRLINQRCLETFKIIDPENKYRRSISRLLRMNYENLTTKQRQQLRDYFKEQPAVKNIYHFKQRLHRLMMLKTCRAKEYKKLIPIFLAMVNELKKIPFEALAKLGRTLFRWREAIVCMWRFTKNNGITEGFHRKMKLIQRQAYGFRNFDNYRLRVKVLCG